MLEIATADEHEDAGGLVIECDEGALQIIGRHAHVRNGELLGVAVATGEGFVGRVAVTGMLFHLGEMRFQ